MGHLYNQNTWVLQDKFIPYVIPFSFCGFTSIWNSYEVRGWTPTRALGLYPGGGGYSYPFPPTVFPLPYSPPNSRFPPFCSFHPFLRQCGCGPAPRRRFYSPLRSSRIGHIFYFHIFTIFSFANRPSPPVLTSEEPTGVPDPRRLRRTHPRGIATRNATVSRSIAFPLADDDRNRQC